MHDVDVAVGILEHVMNKDVGATEEEDEMQQLEGEEGQGDGMQEDNEEEEEAKKR